MVAGLADDLPVQDCQLVRADDQRTARSRGDSLCFLAREAGRDLPGIFIRVEGLVCFRRDGLELVEETIQQSAPIG